MSRKVLGGVVALRTLRLGDVCIKIGSGATPRGGNDVYVARGVSLIRSQNIHNDGFREEGLAFIGVEHAAQLASVEVKTGDVLLNITGDSVARSCPAPSSVIPARVNQHVAIIRPDPDKIDARYLHYHLISPATQEAMLSLASGGATRNALTKGMIENFAVPAPSLSAQRNIARVLCALDDKIEQNRRTARALERLARAIFRAWFVDFEPVKAKAAGATAFPSMPQPVFDALPTRLVGSAIGPVPEGWDVLRLDDLLTLQRGFDLPKPSRTDGSHPVFAASGLNGSHSEWKVKGPGVTTGRSGILGQVFFVDRDFWPLNTSLWVKEYKRSNPWHAYFLLQTLDLAQFNAGSAVPTLNRNHVHSLPIVAPPHNLLEAFEQTCSLTFSLDRQVRNESDKLAAMRNYLLPKLLSGAVAVDPR